MAGVASADPVPRGILRSVYLSGLFGWVMVAGNKNPATGQTEAIHAGLAQLGQAIHEWLGYLLVVAITLHLAGALKHHLLDKDRTLLRMLGR